MLWEFVKEDESEVAHLPGLTVAEILRWADAHFREPASGRRGGRGAIPESPELDGRGAALFLGLRGLEGGSTLPKLLLEHRGRYNRKGRDQITENDILEWADEWHERTGEWPRAGPE